MTYVIGKPCVDVMDRSCIEECPVDCIYEGARALYIHPDGMRGLRAREPVCPVEAIYYEGRPSRGAAASPGRDNAAFFTESLPGRDGPVGSAGGAARLGRSAMDTPLVSACLGRKE